MRTVFADTFYWVALINPNDDWYNRVLEVSRSMNQVNFVTAEEVLTEVQTFYAESGRSMRQRAVTFIDSILSNATVQVLEQTHVSFSEGLELYRQRPDKGYSLTDCVSMQAMKKLEIAEVLTHDRHFAQEEFAILFK